MYLLTFVIHELYCISREMTMVLKFRLFVNNYELSLNLFLDEFTVP